MRAKIKKILADHAAWLDGKGGAKADFGYMNLDYTDFSDLNLAGVNFKYANLTNADFTNANLRKANLKGANLKGANLAGASLVWANLKNANLEQANLDFSCLPLWCWSLDMRVDKRIAVQLLYHAIKLMQGVDDAECQYVSHLKSVIALCNKFHRIPEVEELKTEVTG